MCILFRLMQQIHEDYIFYEKLHMRLIRNYISINDAVLTNTICINISEEKV